MSQPAAAVLHKYKQLLRLIRRLPAKDSEAALREARDKMRAGSAERNPEARLARMKELSARLGYLRIVTPRTPGEVEAQAGTFVLNKEGELVESAGAGAGPGRRVLVCACGRGGRVRARARMHACTTHALAWEGLLLACALGACVHARHGALAAAAHCVRLQLQAHTCPGLHTQASPPHARPTRTRAGWRAA